MIIRRTFPQVYALESPDKGKYWLVSARSTKWGLNQRKIFSTEDLALKYARDLEAQVIQNGKQSDIPKEKLQLAASYEKLVAKLSSYGRTPEEAVNHFLAHLGNEAAKQAKPFIRDLVDSWKQFKYADSTLSHRTVVEIRSYARFIKTKWGGLKPDDLKRNDIDLLLKKLKIANNTRRKYLLYVRMFFSWMKAEGHISQNPTDGIKYKVGGFNGAFYTPEDTKKLLRYVAEKEPDLIGYYALLTFAGLRPSEGARVQWKDFSFATNELYVRPGKAGARHCPLEPVAVAWMKWHRDNSPKDAPLLPAKGVAQQGKDNPRSRYGGRLDSRWPPPRVCYLLQEPEEQHCPRLGLHGHVLRADSDEDPEHLCFTERHPSGPGGEESGGKSAAALCRRKGSGC